jgi:soluble lytic murein transglycosylase-like protein
MAATQTYDTVIGVSVREPGFDSGEPEGLEQLVATHKIVPMAKPSMISNAVLTTETRLVVPQAEQPFKKSGTPIDALITKYASLYGIPESLLHRVVRRESTYNPRAFNRGHYGLMQIKYSTAKSMGYEGPAEGLFDAETNIKYAGKYLRGAWMVADDKNDGAVRLYAAGYYYHAKRKGLLDETGLR